MAKILLVEDDRNLGNLTKTTLLKKGYEVMLFHDARKAIDAMAQQRPDLILMDIMLPEFSGAQAVKELQKHPDLSNIPVIFLTGLISNTEQDVEKMGINIEGVKYKTLGKPYEIKELLKVVDSYIKRAKE
jgi:DNA-binding response OmpR family regulator